MIFYLIQDERSSSIPEDGNSKIGFWSGGTDKSAMSVSQYVEANSDRLRDRYLAFVYEMGERNLGDKKLKAAFEFGKGFNLWWMSLIVEKSLAKTPRIYECMKLLALEEMLSDVKPKNLTFIGGDKTLNLSISHLCSQLGISYSWKRLRVQSKSDVKPLFDYLPHIIQAASWYGVTFLKKINFLAGKKSKWFSEERSVFFMSYLVHLAPHKSGGGRYYSKFWEILPEVLHSKQIKTNYLHHYIAHKQVPDPRTALSIIDHFNDSGNGDEYHHILESYSSVKHYVRCVLTYIRCCIKYFLLTKNSNLLRPTNSVATFEHFLKIDWETSLVGKVALENIHFSYLFDKALADLPKQNVGFYLQENQGWERAFINAWRINGHKRLIGVAHSTIRYWDLRYYDDSRSFTDFTESAGLPRPDYIAVNGPHAFNQYVIQGYPENEILQAEALRYLHEGSIVIPGTKSHTLRILLCGDIDSHSTDTMLKYVAEADANLEVERDVEYVFKPHPSSRINLDHYKIRNITQTEVPLTRQMLMEYDILVAAGMTSAAIDGYNAGLHVIVTLADETINLSPLRGVPHANFVSSGKELAATIQRSLIDSPEDNKIVFFNDSRELSRWLSIIENELTAI